MYGGGFDWIHKWKVSAVTNGTVTEVKCESGVSWQKFFDDDVALYVDYAYA